MKGERRFRPACSTPAVEGMEVVTLDDEIRAARRLCLELLLSDHCGDCVPPCRLACPAGCDARGYLGFISQRRYGDAECPNTHENYSTHFVTYTIDISQYPAKP